MTEKCLKGINWGNLTVNENKLGMTTDGKNLFNLNLKKLQNSTINKNDIVMEFTTDDLKDDDDCICEMRFYIPPSQNQPEQQPKENEGGSDEESKENGVQNYAQILLKEILNKADIKKFTGESIATITDLQLIVPRGKYTIDMYKQNVRFHGHSYNYIVEYKVIKRAFLLPLPDELHFAFVLGLDTPVKQGSTMYPYIIMNLKKEDVAEPIKVKLKEEEYTALDIKDEYSGEFYNLVATLFKKIAKVNIFIPGKFKSSDGQSCLKCTVKTNPGFMFPLSTSIIFINKPVFYITMKDIQTIEFHRIGTGALNKMFDIKIITNKLSHQLVGFDRKELDGLMKYFQEKKVNIKKCQDDVFTGQTFDIEGEDDYSDPSDSGGEKPQKREKSNLQPNLNDLLEDDEDDSDFEGGGGEESSDEDDMDDEGSDIQEIREEQKKKANKQQKKEKKEKPNKKERLEKDTAKKDSVKKESTKKEDDEDQE